MINKDDFLTLKNNIGYKLLDIEKKNDLQRATLISLIEFIENLKENFISEFKKIDGLIEECRDLITDVEVKYFND